MNRRPTQSDIAKIAGVSQRVVASVIGQTGAGGPRTSEATRQRILAAAKSINYRPQRQAQLLRGVKSGVIGIIKNVSFLQASVETAYHASLAIHRAGYELLVQENLWSGDKGLEQMIGVLLDSRVEGVLLATDLHEKHYRALKNAGIPIVSIGMPRSKEIPFVAPDQRQGMRDLTRHLLSLGHQRLVLETFIRPTNDETSVNWSTQERLKGFLEACEQAGLDGNQRRVINSSYRDGYFDFSELGFQTARTMINAAEELPDALLCQNDLHALGAQKCLFEQMIPVPKRVALTGFDDTFIGRHLAVPLTTVAQPVAELSNHAVELLVDLIRGNKAVPPHATLLPCTLVVRESCGAHEVPAHLEIHQTSPPSI